MTELMIKEIDHGLQPFIHITQSLVDENKSFLNTNKYLTDLTENIKLSNLHHPAKSFINSINENLNFKSQNDFNKIMKNILHGDVESPILNIIENKALKQHMLKKYPFKLYEEHINNVNKLAQDLGFENETQFLEYLESNPSPTDSKLTKIFNTMTKWAGKHKSLILKSAILLGVGVAFLEYLNKYNRKNSGCFRYHVGKGHSLKKEVYLTRFCKFPINRVDYINYDILNDNTHPLFNKKVWNCQFDIPNSAETQNILNLGCKGICCPHNYNYLSQFVKGYEPISNLENKEIFYIYKCEQGTILRNIAEILGDGIGEVIQGIGQSDIWQFILKSIKNIGWVILLILLLIIMLGPLIMVIK